MRRQHFECGRQEDLSDWFDDPRDKGHIGAANRARARLGMSQDSFPYTEGGVHRRMLGVPRRERHRQLLNIAYYAFCKKVSEGKLKATAGSKIKWFVNISQGCDRGAPGSEHMPSLVQHSTVYSFELDAVLPQDSHQVILGLPQGLNYSTLSQSQIHSLAGEGVDCGCEGVILYSLYMNPHARHWSRETNELAKQAADRCQEQVDDYLFKKVFGPKVRKSKKTRREAANRKSE